MKELKCICMALALCGALASCESSPVVTADTQNTADTVISTAPGTEATVTYEVAAPAETAVITTAPVTAETVPETTEEAPTTVAPETTVSLAEKAPEVTYSEHVPTVLDGEYTFGGEPIIENINGFTYVNGILIANKTYPLPDGFDPGGLHPDAEAAFNQMQADAAAEGITLKIISGYRSYSHQTNTYNRYVARDGQASADRYSARPGHSEHQTGLAMDINSLYQSFGETPEGIWLTEHCAEYGFIIRYLEEKEAETGFMYEPWHIRYVGEKLAAEVTASGLCLEEFLGITSAYAE